jgi:hypothetical protein
MNDAESAAMWKVYTSHQQSVAVRSKYDLIAEALARAAGLRLASAAEEQTLDMLLANIALADQEGRPLSYSRNNNHSYGNDVTVGTLRAAVGIVTRADLALERRTKPGHRGWQSDLRGTRALADIFDAHGVEPVYGPVEPIIMRSRKDGSRLPLQPMRDRQRQVERANEMLRSASLNLEMTGAIRLRNNLYLFERLEEDRFGPRLVQQKLRLE